MADQTQYTETLRRLRWQLFLTRTGLLAERLARCFWPLWTILIAALALLMLGVQDSTSIELVWALTAAVVLGAGWFAVRGAMRFHWPSGEEALKRLDGSLKGNPIQSLRDAQAIGAGDAGSAALWAAHQKRMAEQAALARAPEPDLKLARADPFGLRYVGLLLLMVALLFGSFMRVGSVGQMAPGSATAAIGPSWEGWLSPPPYTALPTLYLPDITSETLIAPEGSEVTMRLYGPAGRLSVDESVSGRSGDLPPAETSAQDFIIRRDGVLRVEGPGGREWQVVMIPDSTPQAAITGAGHANVDGEISIPFHASDDYGVETGEAVIRLDLTKVDRRYGLRMDPEPREDLVVPLPMPISGSRKDFEEALIENFSRHPWANMPVTVTLKVQDMQGQEGTSAPYEMDLDARRFFDPLAAGFIEMRRDLLWNRANAPRVAQVLRAISWEPGTLFRDEALLDRTRDVIGQIEGAGEALTDDEVAAIAEALWDMATELEEGDLDDARERMQQAQERLNEAMRNGASDEEIAQLMQELRDATQDYLRQLSQQAARESEQNPDQPPMSMENAMEMNQDDLQRMMDRIQELMEQGRMAEAQQALEELQRMMENMQVTQGQQGGQGQQSEGQQAMDGLAETLRDQQGLSDEAFRELQDQFNQGGQGQERQPGQPGQGQQPEQGQQPGSQMGQGQQPGEQPGQEGQPGGAGGADAGTLAERQQQLRDELNRQRGNLPGGGTEAGRAAREALDEAGRAMGSAEQALRDGDLPEAIEQQSQAMDALREGMRQVGEAMSEQERQFAGQQGEGQGETPGRQNDPLGRNSGENEDPGSTQEMLQGEDVYRQAQNLLDEIRRRSGDSERSQQELDYLNRLLERF